MSVSGAQGKTLVLKYENNEVIFKLIDEGEKEIDSVSMDVETSALFVTLLNHGVVTAEEINRKFKKEGIKLQKIQDVGTCFANESRVSIAILPADDKRTASILVGIHKEEEHSSIIIKPKRAAYLGISLTKILINNME
ncbi:conserved hypothetical protein [Methanococcus vannielii SB]|uniref:Uncharacterized protein n=1 Tax=Methanococcus vannielii (strain ATCC 35089 / DSM 1224 / JCM 13029 / OCM 148 / SB) TaxID=406327 RepID=A6URX1_METVS|nr:hypothetical protein [Methanococcus vannielii]ABR55243.1 conserved hypothetical protein [Methanococcus vannielii SB]